MVWRDRSRIPGKAAGRITSEKRLLEKTKKRFSFAAHKENADVWDMQESAPYEI